MNADLVELFLDQFQVLLDELFTTSHYRQYLTQLDQLYQEFLLRLIELYPGLESLIRSRIPTSLEQLAVTLTRRFERAQGHDPLQEYRQQLEAQLVKLYVSHSTVPD